MELLLLPPLPAYAGYMWWWNLNYESKHTLNRTAQTDLLSSTQLLLPLLKFCFGSQPPVVCRRAVSRKICSPLSLRAALCAVTVGLTMVMVMMTRVVGQIMHNYTRPLSFDRWRARSMSSSSSSQRYQRAGRRASKSPVGILATTLQWVLLLGIFNLTGSKAIIVYSLYVVNYYQFQKPLNILAALWSARSAMFSLLGCPLFVSPVCPAAAESCWNWLLLLLVAPKGWKRRDCRPGESRGVCCCWPPDCRLPMECCEW